MLGGSGYIGKNLVQSLPSNNHLNIVSADVTLPETEAKSNVTYSQFDLHQPHSLNELFRPNDIVFNCAGFANVDMADDNAVLAYRLNVAGALNVVEACIDKNVNKLVHLSSIYASGDRGGVYGSSKKIGEELVRQLSRRASLRFSIVRLGSVYDDELHSNNSLVKFLNKILLKKIQRLQRLTILKEPTSIWTMSVAGYMR